MTARDSDDMTEMDSPRRPQRSGSDDLAGTRISDEGEAVPTGPIAGRRSSRRYGPRRISAQGPLSSFLASAARLSSITARNPYTARLDSAEDSEWQDDAWRMYDLVGELAFLVNTLADRLSKARLYVGKLDPNNVTNTPDEVDREADSEITDLLTSFGKTLAGREQLLRKLSVNLAVPGESWLLGVPSELVGEGTPLSVDSLEDVHPSDLRWFALSTDEIKLKDQGKILSVKMGDESRDLTVALDSAILVRVWEPHPRWGHRPYSAVKSTLPALSELVGVTLYSSGQIQSRLAGAGLLVVSEGMDSAYKVKAGLIGDGDESPFTDELVEYMTTPIADRSSPSAVVPLVVTVPDDLIDGIRHLTFATELDDAIPDMGDRAIRRVALSMDAPPEVLLGTSSANHWGAWLIREDTISTHTEPDLALICDALTTQYLWPMLQTHQGMTPEEAEQYVIWYDVSHLVTRPNYSSDAFELHARGIISDEMLRKIAGMDDDPDMPELNRAESLALSMVRDNPQLLASPGMVVLVRELSRLFNGSAYADAEEELRLPEEQQTEVTVDPGAAGTRRRRSGGGTPLIPHTDQDGAPEEDEDPENLGVEIGTGGA